MSQRWANLVIAPWLRKLVAGALAASLPGALTLVFAVAEAPIAQAANPTPAVSLSASASKISGTTWTNDGSSGTNVTLSTSGLFSAADTAVVFNSTAASTNYATGSYGSTTSDTATTLEFYMKVPSSQWTSNSSYGYLFAFTNSYGIWIRPQGIGFNTGNSEIYGIPLTNLTGSYHHFTFVASNTSTDSNQKIYVDGVQQTLSYVLGTTAVQANKTFNSGGSFIIGKYGTNSPDPYYAYASIRNLDIYHGELSATQVGADSQQFTNTSSTPSCNPTLSPNGKTYVFNNVGACLWTIPRGASSLNLDARGAMGGPGKYRPYNTQGYGGQVLGTVNVTGLNQVIIYVGGMGQNADSGTSALGGFNGGGNSGIGNADWNGGGGGGATDIRVSDTLNSRFIVAGGGGGNGAWYGNSCCYNMDAGGAGGGLTGGIISTSDGGSGGGGTQTAGGSGNGGTSGSFGIGGNGQNKTITFSGAGGGGGYYGGGGGTATIGSGGGGGSSYTNSNYLSSVTHNQGVNCAPGFLALTVGSDLSQVPPLPDCSSVGIGSTAPAVSSSTFQSTGKTFTITFTSSTTPPLSTAAPSPSAIGVTVNGVNRTVTAVSCLNSVMTVTLATPVVPSDSVTVTYTDPTSTDDLYAIQNAAGLDAAAFALSLSTSGIVNQPTITTLSNPSTSSETITWSVGTGGPTITDYLVEYSSDSGTTWTTFSHTASTAKSIQVTGLTSGNTYLFRVTSVSASGNSLVSANSTPVLIPGPITISGPLSVSYTYGVGGASTNRASGGTGSKNLSGVLSPSNPGITLDTSTPSAVSINVSSTAPAGTYYETITATDGYGLSATTRVTIVINGAIVETATSYAPSTTRGFALVDTITATSGTGNKSFTFVGNPTNSGITLDTSTASSGYVRLNVSAAVPVGTYVETVTVTDTAGASASVTIVVTVNQPVVLTPANVGPLTIESGTANVDTLTATLGTGAYRHTLSVTPSNAGITLDTATAGLAILKVGASVPVGTYTATVTTVDAVGSTDSDTIVINVVYPRIITQPATCTPDAGFTNCIYVGYTGIVQSYTLPSYLFPGLPIQIEEWGAGGGGSWYTSGWVGSNGGAAGGYTKAKHTIVSRDETLTVLVGQGGASQQNVSTFGGGGAGGPSIGGQIGSNGGGFSAVYLGSDTTTPFLISGGGGGASPGDAGNVAGGGGAAGNSGNDGIGVGIAGGGGTLTAGGAAASSCSNSAATQGLRYQGGVGSGSSSLGFEGGGGGGGGYFGGGGGACQNGSGGPQNGGGGGGSGYLNSLFATLITATNGGNGTQGYANPGGTASSQWKLSAGVGGLNSANSVAQSTAGNGLVVIQWNAAAPVISFDSNSSTSGLVPLPITEVDTVTIILPGNTGTLLKNGFTAVKWSTALNGTGTSYNFGDSFTTTTSTKLYAQYGATLNFDLNGGSGTTPSSILRTDTSSFVLPKIDSSTFSNSGTTFTSWNTRADGSGTFYRSGDTITLTPVGGAQTLYAYWAGPLTLTGSTGSTLKTTVTIAASETITVLNGTGTKRLTLTSSSNMNGGITLDTSTAGSGYVVLKVSNTTLVDTYTETITVVDSVGATTSFVVKVVVNPFPIFNGSIVSSGLALNLDAGNRSSYSGSGTTWSDLSGNGKNGTFVGSPIFTTNSGGYFTFNGTTTYGTAPTLGLLTNFTAEAWSKQNATPVQYQGILTEAQTTGALNFEIYWNSANTVIGGYLTAAGVVVGPTVTFTPSLNTWNHFAVTFDGTNVKLYINGVLMGTTAASGILASSGQSLNIGAIYNHTVNNSASISAAHVYNRSLTATEILQNYYALANRYGSTVSGDSYVALSQAGTLTTPTYVAGSGTDTITITSTPTIAGLTPNISGNTISFTAANTLAAGSYIETVTGTDSVGAKTTFRVYLTMSANVSSSAMTNNIVTTFGNGAVDTITTGGGSQPITYSLTGLPSSAYVTLDTSTSGSGYIRLVVNPLLPAGTYTETITVTDALGYSSTQIVTITINVPPQLTHPQGYNGVGLSAADYSKAILKTGLALQIEFNDTATYSGAGTTINSLVGTIAGTTTNSPAYTSTGGGYFTLDGVNGLNKDIRTNTGTATTGNISQFAWVYPTADGVITSEYNAAASWLYQNMIISGGKLLVQFYQGTLHTSTMSVPFNQWNYVGYTYDGTTIKTYINGQLAGTSASARSAPASDQWLIGYGYSGYAWGNFRIGSLHVYSTTLSALDIQKNFVYTNPRYESVGVTVLQTTAGIPVSKSGYIASLGTGNKSISISPLVSGTSIDTSTTNQANYSVNGTVAAGSIIQRMKAVDQVGINAQYNVLTIINPAMSLSAIASIETTSAGVAIGPDTVTVTGGTGTHTFALTGSPTTTGFTLTTISDTQTALTVAGTAPAGIYFETITVTDSVGAIASTTVKVIVNGAALLSASAALVNLNYGSTVSDTVTVTGGTGPFAFALTGSPTIAGISLDSSLATSGQAVVKFAATVPVGQYIETVTVTDSKGGTSTTVMTFYVNATVNFNINGGSGVTPSSITQSSLGSITLPGSSGFSKPGYTFTGWVDSNTVFNKNVDSVTSLTTGANPHQVLLSLDGSTVYTPNWGANNVSIVNISSGTKTDVTVGTNPYAEALSPDGTYLWVSNWSSNTVSRINLSNNTVTTINVGSTPAGLQVTSDGKWVYVANWSSSTVSKINTSTLSVTSISVGSVPHAVVIAPDNSYVYTANWSGASMSKISVAGDTVTAITTGSLPRAIAISPNGQFVYTANWNSNTLTKYNTVTNTTSTISLVANSDPFALTFSPDGSTLYVSYYNLNPTWSKVSVSSDTITSYTISGSFGGPIAVTRDNQYLYLGDRGNATIYKIKISDGIYSALTTATGFSYVETPQTPVLTSDGNIIYFAGYNGSTVSQVIYSNTLSLLPSSFLPTRNMTLLAQWTPRSYTITYDSNSATSGNPSRLVDTYTTNASAITLPLVGTMVKAGYTFGGWARTRTGASIGLSETSTTTDETLYAVWTANPYTISFNANGASGTMSGESITAGSPAVLNQNTFARTGFNFSGWNETTTGTAASYANGATITFFSNKTLYAQWTIKAPDAPIISSVVAGNDSVTVNVTPGSQSCSQYISGPGTVLIDTTTAPGYCIYKITAGAETLTVPTGVSNMEVFAVAGGGGGGWGANAGGGGGGGIIYNPAMSVTGGSIIQLKTGAGGSGNGAGNGATGESSTVGTFVAVGGGGGSGIWGTRGLVGGSSGGSSGTILNGSVCGSTAATSAAQYSYSGWTTYGSAGGPGCPVGGTLEGGGGGGASSPGLIDGTGGTGLVSAITGTSVTYAAGGRGYGGIQGYSAGTAGSANTGTGGGPAANGGSGFIFIKFVDQTGGAPTVETVTALDAAGNVLSPARSCVIQSGSGSCVIEGLTNLTAYKFVATAANTSGASTISSAAPGTPQPWVVTFSGESGTVSPSTQNFNYPFANTLPTPIRPGYDFNGWYNARTGGTLIGSAGDTYTVSGATTFYARWTPITYSIRYDSNTATGGSAPAQGSYATGGSPYVIVGNTGTMVKAGHTFSGWNTAANATGTSYAIGFQDSATVNLVLYAQWTPIAYTVTYLLNGGSGTAPTQGSLNIGQQFSVAAITGISKTGYTFTGWVDSTTTNYLGGSLYTVGTSNIVLTAQWSVNKYTVTYDPNGATGKSTDTSTIYTYGSSALTLSTVGTMAKTGYSFAGWSTSANGSVLVGPYIPTASITLYALWTANPYTITFNSNFGTPVTRGESITAGFQAILDTNTFTRVGYKFSNWAVNQDGTGTSYSDRQTLTLYSNLTLYAQWTIAKPDTPTISTLSAGNESATVSVAAANTGGAPTSYIVTAAPGGLTCSVTPPATSCVINGLTNGQAYTFTAVAINGTGTSASSTASASVTPTPYTVTYNAGAGASADSSTAYYSVGDPLTLPGATKPGFTFAGWFTAASGGTLIGPAGAAYSPNSNITLYAQWTGISYSITYNGNGNTSGSVPALGTFVSGGSAYVIAGNSGSLARSGYTFSGWSTASGIGGTTYSVGANYSETRTLSLYATWTPAALTISYAANGGTNGAPAPLTKYVGDTFTVAASTTFVKNGYNFAGWSDGRSIYPAGARYTMGTSSETLTAQWTAIAFTVDYSLNGAAGTAPATITRNINESFTVAVVGTTRAGYTFAGWSDGSNVVQPGSMYTITGSNVILTAQWSALIYVITYDTSTAAGGSATRASDSFSYGSAPIALPQVGTLIKPGYTFDGWAETTSVIVGQYAPTASVTLHPVWSANTYSVNYDGNGGSTPDTPTVTYTSGTGGMTLEAQGTLARTGYTFQGWSTTANGSNQVNNGFAPTMTTTLYAIWNIRSFAVTFDTGTAGGTQTTPLPANTSVDYNGLITIPSYSSTDTGFAFAGWKDSTQLYSPGATLRMGTTPVTLTAQWIAIYTVHYTLNGGSPTINDVHHLDGDTITLVAAPTRTGYDFLGWNNDLDPAHPILAANSQTTVSASSYLFSAQWNPATYTFTFDTGTTVSMSVSHGSTVSLPAAPTRLGYLFKNWLTGANTTYGAGATLIATSNTAFVASWTSVKYTIYYDLAQGRTNVLIKDIDPAVGDTIVISSVVPFRAGYRFLGWSDGGLTSPVGGGYWQPGATYTQPATDVTLTAVWDPIIYTIIYNLGGAPGIAPTQTSLAYGSTFTLAATPTWVNYSFMGWNDGTNTQAALSTYTVGAGTVTLTAQWVSTLYTATYSLNGGTGTLPTAVNANIGETFTVALLGNIAKQGYTFAGWSDGSHTYAAGAVYTMTSSNIALTAQWTLQAPGTPPAPLVTPGNGSALITVNAPTSGGLSTSYIVTAQPSGLTCTVVSPAASCTISPLPNGTVQSFTVTATNSTGKSSASSATLATPASVPKAPTNLVATAGNGSATLTFTAPTNGGSAITSYIVTISPTGETRTVSGSPVVVTGLTNGQPYTFTVNAVNALGKSDTSTASGSITPATTPSAPTILSTTVSGGAATISFNAPASNGGSAITSYTVISQSGGLTATGSTSPIVVPGLVTGQPYQFTVYATNAMGAGDTATLSQVVVSALKPDVPVNVTAIAGNETATVTFSAPTNNGGSAITSYTVTASPGGETVTVTNSPATFTGLTIGQAYTFTVTATNAIGTSLSSTASLAVTPTAPPSAPLNVRATGAPGSATIAFDTPTSIGGTPITGYLIIPSPTPVGGPSSFGASGSPLTITGLTNGTTYTFIVKAINAAGTSIASTTSLAVTPATIPDTPTSVVATPMDGGASVVFTAPAANGSVITNYTVTASNGATASGSSSPIKFTGLTNGTAYTFVVTAINGIGVSDTSLPSATITPAKVPGVPKIDTITLGRSSATISVSPTSAGGSTITSYTITASPGGATCTVTPPATSCRISGLTSGSPYTFTAVATNAVGASFPSQASNPIIPIDVPDVPGSILAAPLSNSASISFSAPNNHGSAITSYIVTNIATGESFTATTSPILVSGLTNGTTTTLSVEAVNAVGSSNLGIITVVPRTFPNAPSITSVSTGNQSATITVAPPANNGGAPITSYTVTASPGGATCTVISPATSCTIPSGLVNGAAYTFTTVATNAAGSGLISAPSAPATPSTVPNAPTSISASASPNSATVSFVAPSIDGGSPITGYIVTSSPAGGSCTTDAVTLACTVSGLTNGITYSFNVEAVNANGNSTAGTSNSVTPITRPAAPTNIVATPQDGAASVTFTAPRDNGGSTITQYVVTASPGGIGCLVTPPATSCLIQGLTNGVAYTFSVYATNGVGNSASGISNAVTPEALSGAAGTTFTLTQGSAYSINLAATGGSAPITYALTNAVLPSGITLDLNAGVISGAPSTFGNYVETVTATDAAGATVVTILTLVVAAPSVPSNNNNSNYIPSSPAPGVTPPTPTPPTPTPPGVTPPTPTPPTPTPPGPIPPSPTPPTPTPPAPTPSTTPATSPKSVDPAVTAQANSVAGNAVIKVPFTAPVGLITPANSPASIQTIASASGTSMAVIITPKGTPAQSYLITAVNSKTSEVITQLVTGSPSTQSIALSGLNPGGAYKVTVVANTAAGQVLAGAGNIAQPKPITAPSTKIQPAVLALANQASTAVTTAFPLSSSIAASLGTPTPTLAKSVLATTSTDGQSLAMTILPPANASDVKSYIVMVTDRTTGIVTTQQVAAGADPSSLALAGLAPGDKYSVAVVAANMSGSQAVVMTTAILMAGTPRAKPAPGTIKLKQTPNTTDSANAPKIVSLTPKAAPGSKNKNKATINIGNLKPGQKIKVTLKDGKK
jgi:uncharacterized repeat protein (TIGR02543 family)